MGHKSTRSACARAGRGDAQSEEEAGYPLREDEFYGQKACQRVTGAVLCILYRFIATKSP